MTQLALDYTPLPAELTLRIRTALSSDLSECERDVLRLLTEMPSGPRTGRAKALSIGMMQALWSRAGTRIWTERTIKDACKNLLERFEVPIGSSRRSGCSGFYLCVTDQDAEDTVRPYKSEIYSLFRRIKCLAPESSFVRKLNGQMQLIQNEEARSA